MNCNVQGSASILLPISEPILFAFLLAVECSTRSSDLDGVVGHSSARRRGAFFTVNNDFVSVTLW